MISMAKIIMASDHGGFALKAKIAAWLASNGYEAVDAGPQALDKNDDYPDYALKACKKIAGTGNIGILICSSGQGMDRAANKIKGIYASVCWNKRSVKYAKAHGGINVLCLPADFVGPRLAIGIVRTWLDTPTSMAERHVRRRDKVVRIERA